MHLMMLCRYTVGIIASKYRVTLEIRAGCWSMALSSDGRAANMRFMGTQCTMQKVTVRWKIVPS